MSGKPIIQKQFSFEAKVPQSFSLKKSQVDFLKDLVEAGLYPNVSECVSQVLDVFINSIEQGQDAREKRIQEATDFILKTLYPVYGMNDYEHNIAEYTTGAIPTIPTNEELVSKDVLQKPTTTVVTDAEEAELLKGIIEIAMKRRLKPQSIVDEWVEGRLEDFDRVFKGNKAYLLRKLEAEQSKNQETFVVPKRPSIENERKEAKERHINEIMQNLPGKIHTYLNANDGEKTKILQDDILPEVERVHRYMDKPERDPFTTMLIERLQPIINERYLTDPKFEYQDALEVINLAARRVTPSRKDVPVISETTEEMGQ
jgi:Arc/MetJ-type ribon-helix-helix transcriptional regulator